MSGDRPPGLPVLPDDEATAALPSVASGTAPLQGVSSRSAPLGAAPAVAPEGGGSVPPRPARALGWLSVAILCALCLMAGVLIGRRHHPNAVPVVPATGVLLAAPNPVPDGGGEGTTVISWITPDGAVGQVWMASDGQGEVLFAQGASGAQYAPFILTGHTYVFRLYAGTGHAGEAAQAVTVTHPT